MDIKTRPKSFSSHSKFFTSLKQVEKRLKLDHISAEPIGKESQVEEESNFPSSSNESLISPMFLHLDQTTATQSSELPQAFLSISQDFPTTQTTPSHNLTTVNNPHENGDEIEQLMELLGLSLEENDGFYEDGSNCSSCHCEGGFYSKVVGVEGPKCRKEVKRLDGWIKHFMNSGGEDEKVEPLRLAYLLLGKAAFISEGVDDGFGGLHFPSTIQEFLHTNPPGI